MKIQNMFVDDINRKINGVIKVDQADNSTVEQELSEYVITKELKKHFINFFNYYSDALDEPTDDTGVWISGFFGSGKSMLLKIFEKILKNEEINGVRTVERFRKKFEDDPATFMMIDKAVSAPTETILFNIDIEGPLKKDRTAIIRVFAKTFYSHLGYYGEDLKLAMMEKYIDQEGKTEQFRAAFEQQKGKPWVECRRAVAFNKKYVISALQETLAMSEEDARAWFEDKTEVDFSIAQLVEDIKDYVSSKPKNFRLLFMIDEVGQYIGTDTDMLLNLQSILEKIGSECGGKVWVVCTGQEAIDEIIKVRADEFSRIQARFKTRLSLSSSSVDEVIQKRILKKNKEAEQTLSTVYDLNDSTLRNLFSFTDSLLDIKGYSGPDEFVVNFPFVPYQFIIMQKVFAEIRKHGNSGKHLSGGERSMLSGFQEATQRIQEENEYALVPFSSFYDTVHVFLDSSIRRVIERCQKAADNHDGIEQQDVEVLKLLYLVRYIDDIPANINNIAILMADDIRMDPIKMREEIRKSLNRLYSQQYINRVNDVYIFLTDEEQDIQREIANTQIDTAKLIESIGNRIFGDIYSVKKYRYKCYDFPINKMVDSIHIGVPVEGMTLQFLTVAADPSMNNDSHLVLDSKGKIIVSMAETQYYDNLERAEKINTYVKRLNKEQLPQSVQKIIRAQQDEATKYILNAKDELEKAIKEGIFYIDGQKQMPKGGTVYNRINQAFEYLVSHVYDKLDFINHTIDSDADIAHVLKGDDAANILPGQEGYRNNRSAAIEMEEFMEIQYRRKLPTSMADIHARYSKIPFGWRELDIAGVMAILINEQKVSVKYGGTILHADDPQLPVLLHKKSEIGKVSVTKREILDPTKLRAARDLMRDYLDVMDVPDNENKLVDFIIYSLDQKKTHYVELYQHYNGRHYPDYALVTECIETIDDVLAQQKDNNALINSLLTNEDALMDDKEAIQRVEGFFDNQVTIFDKAVDLVDALKHDLSYLEKNEQARKGLKGIEEITGGTLPAREIYRRVPELNGFINDLNEGYNILLDNKRGELREIIHQSIHDLKANTNDTEECQNVIAESEGYYQTARQNIASQQSMALLDGMIPGLWSAKDRFAEKLDLAKTPATQPVKPVLPAQNIKKVFRQAIFPAKVLNSEEEVNQYVESIRQSLMGMLKDCDGIKLD